MWVWNFFVKFEIFSEKEEGSVRQNKSLLSKKINIERISFWEYGCHCWRENKGEESSGKKGNLFLSNSIFDYVTNFWRLMMGDWVMICALSVFVYLNITLLRQRSGGLGSQSKDFSLSLLLVLAERKWEIWRLWRFSSKFQGDIVHIPGLEWTAARMK